MTVDEARALQEGQEVVWLPEPVFIGVVVQKTNEFIRVRWSTGRHKFFWFEVKTALFRNLGLKCKADVTIQNEGSIYLAHLNTDAAREWVNENVSDESQYFGQALVVEPRYLDNLIAGMCEAGLTVE